MMGPSCASRPQRQRRAMLVFEPLTWRGGWRIRGDAEILRVWGWE